MTESQSLLVKKILYDIELQEITAFDNLGKCKFDNTERFNKKVNKLINEERARENSILKLHKKTKLSILVATIVIFTIAFTSCIFAEQIKEFVITVYDTMTQFFIPYDDTEDNYTEHSITYIPDGYELLDEFRTNFYVAHTYSNQAHTITIDQAPKNGINIHINTDDSSYKIIYIGVNKIHYSYKQNMHILVWKNDYNVFTLTCHDSISMEEIEKIVLGITLLK